MSPFGRWRKSLRHLNMNQNHLYPGITRKTAHIICRISRKNYKTWTQNNVTLCIPQLIAPKWSHYRAYTVDKFIKKEIESANDTTEKKTLETEQSVVRGGQVFTDQFYSQHMRFHKDVSLKAVIFTKGVIVRLCFMHAFRMNQIPTLKIDFERGLVSGKHLIRKVSMAKQKKLVVFMAMMLPKQR